MAKIVYMAQTISLIANTNSMYVNELIKSGVTKQIDKDIVYLVIEEVEVKQTSENE